MYSLIMLSGGRGKRMMKSIPKQYLLLGGKPIIVHSLERFDQIDEIQEIIIVCESDYRNTLSVMMEQYGIEKPIIFADAGKSRQASVLNGLKKVCCENVIIHEAARPFVSIDDISRLLSVEEENAILGYSIPYTVLRGQQYVEELLDRFELVNVQLPQKFKTQDILKAHEDAVKEGKEFTEDASLLFYYTKKPIKIVEGTAHNIKITEGVDLVLGESIYKEFFGRRK